MPIRLHVSRQEILLEKVIIYSREPRVIPDPERQLKTGIIPDRQHRQLKIVIHVRELYQILTLNQDRHTLLLVQQLLITELTGLIQPTTEVLAREFHPVHTVLHRTLDHQALLQPEVVEPVFEAVLLRQAEVQGHLIHQEDPEVQVAEVFLRVAAHEVQVAAVHQEVVVAAADNIFSLKFNN